MPNCKSFLFTEAERKYVRRRARFQHHRDASFQFLFFPASQGPKEFHAILTETLAEHAPLYATVKNWVTQFKRGDFTTCEAPRPGRPKTVTTPGIIDQIWFPVAIGDHGRNLVISLWPGYKATISGVAA